MASQLWSRDYTPSFTGTLIPSAQRFVWAAKQALGNAALVKMKNSEGKQNQP